MQTNNLPGASTFGTTRRRFISALTALTGLSGLASTASGGDTENNAAESAASHASTGAGDAATQFSASLEVWGGFQNPAEYEFLPSQLEDEAVDVELRVQFDNANVNLAFTQAQAEEFADKLTTAAERGANGLGGD